MEQDTQINQEDTIKLKLRRVIFGTDTRLGRYFDISLIICIILSVTLVFLDTVASINSQYGQLISVLEWFFTIVFTIEYLLRLYCSAQPVQYVRSSMGLSICSLFCRVIWHCSSLEQTLR